MAFRTLSGVPTTQHAEVTGTDTQLGGVVGNSMTLRQVAVDQCEIARDSLVCRPK